MLLLDEVDEREFEERPSDRFMVSVGLELRTLNILFSEAEFSELRLLIPLLPVRPGLTVVVFSFVTVFPVSVRLVVVDLPEFPLRADRLVVLPLLLFFEISGRYRLTERLLTVDLPGREAFVT